MYMKKILLIAMMAFMLPVAVVAQELYEDELYAVYYGDNSLIFYYDGSKDFRSGPDAIPCTTREEWIKYRSIVTRVEFDASCAAARPKDMSYWFYEFSEMIQFDGKYLNTSNVEFMDDMFANCSSLTSLDLSSFDTSNVLTMGSMFKGCTSLTRLNLCHFDTGNVLDMYKMFQDCTALTTLNLAYFDVGNVYDMRCMFDGCKALTTIYCSTDWSADAITLPLDKDADMFRNCTSLVGDNGGTFDPECTNLDYASPDKSYALGYFSKPVLTIDGVPVTQPGIVSLPSIVNGTVTYSEGDLVADYPTLTLDNAFIYCKAEGIFAPDGIVLVLKGTGTNQILSWGTAIFGTDVFPIGEKLNVSSTNGYGIHLLGNACLSASEGDGDDLCYVTVTGSLGAVHGQKRLRKDRSGYSWPTINALNMELWLRTDNSHPAVSGIGSIDESDNSWDADVVFSYESYHFDKERQTVVASPMGDVVTKPFYIVPKQNLHNYGVYLGGEQLNDHNSDEFKPMSLTRGSASYSPGKNILYLANARFDYPYEPTDDCFALQCWKTPQLTVKVKGACSLTGTLTEDYDYGINFSADGSGIETKPQWTIVGDGENASLQLAGTIYFQSTDITGADVLFKDLDVNVTDAAYLWGEDDIDVTIDNCNMTLHEDKYPDMPVIESLNSLVLKGCSLQDGCYWDNIHGRVMDANGDDAKRLVRITRDGDDVATGVGGAPHLNDEHGAVYDLQGRRLDGVGAGSAPARLHKGLYIIDGKKVVMK